MKALISILLLTMAILPVRSEIKFKSASNFVGTHIVLNYSDDEESVPQLSDFVLISNGRQYSCLGMKMQTSGDGIMLDLTFQRIKSPSNARLVIRRGSSKNVITIDEFDGYDVNHPKGRFTAMPTV